MPEGVEEPTRQRGDSISYMDWNDAIWTHFFNPTNADQPVTLALDDNELAEITRQLGLEQEQPGLELFLAVRQFARPESRNVFSWWTSDPDRTGLYRQSHDFAPPSYIALLGACVLIASRMGDSSVGYDKFSYWPKLNSLMLGIDSTKTPEGAGGLDRLWRHLRDYLQTVCEGRLGLLSIQVVTEFSHINFPISQVVLRTADRSTLREYFEHAYPRQASPSRTDVFSTLRSDAERHQYPFSPVFRRMIMRRQGDDAFLAAVEEEVWLTYEHWARNRPTSKDGPRVAIKSKIAESPHRALNDQEPEEGPGTLAHRQSTPNRLALPWRFKFLPFDGAVVIEVLASMIEDKSTIDSPTHDGWARLHNGELTADQVRGGAGVVVGSTDYFFSSHLPLVFEDTQLGWIQRDWVPIAKRFCVLVDSTSGPDLWQFAEAVDPLTTEVPLSEPLRGIDCLRLTIPRDFDQKLLPPALEDLPLESTGDLHLSGGLRINSTTYFSKAPPFVILDVTHQGTAISLNGTRLTVGVKAGVPVPLPTDVCRNGPNSVIADGKAVTFYASDTSGADQETEAGVGFAISRLMGTVRTERDAGGVKEKYLRSVKGVVIIGPYILPDVDY